MLDNFGGSPALFLASLLLSSSTVPVTVPVRKLVGRLMYLPYVDYSSIHDPPTIQAPPPKNKSAPPSIPILHLKLSYYLYRIPKVFLLNSILHQNQFHYRKVTKMSAPKEFALLCLENPLLGK